MNGLDVALIVAVAAAVGFAIWRVARNKKQGKSPCGCDCGHCAGCAGGRGKGNGGSRD